MNARYRTAIVVLCAGLSPAMAASALAVPPFLDVFSYQYANCVQPAYRQADLLMQGRAGRCRIDDVKGEACAVELQERMGVSLQDDVWQHQLSFPPRDATAFVYPACTQIVMILIYNANP